MPSCIARSPPDQWHIRASSGASPGGGVLGERYGAEARASEEGDRVTSPVSIAGGRQFILADRGDGVRLRQQLGRRHDPAQRDPFLAPRTRSRMGQRRHHEPGGLGHHASAGRGRPDRGEYRVPGQRLGDLRDPQCGRLLRRRLPAGLHRRCNQRLVRATVPYVIDRQVRGHGRVGTARLSRPAGQVRRRGQGRVLHGQLQAVARHKPERRARHGT